MCSYFFIISSIFGVFSQFELIQNTYWILGLISIVIGTFSVFKQTNIKRIFAFSSLTHSGIILILISAGSHEGFILSIFYFTTYALGCLAFFTSLEYFKNLFNKSSILTLEHLSNISAIKDISSFLFSASLFSFAGIPPLLGFFSKLFFLEFLIFNGYYLTLTIFIICTIFSTAYYLKIFLSVWSIRKLHSVFVQKLSILQNVILYSYTVLLLISPIFLYFFYQVVILFFS